LHESAGLCIFWQTEACFEAGEKYKSPYFAKKKAFLLVELPTQDHAIILHLISRTEACFEAGKN